MNGWGDVNPADGTPWLRRVLSRPLLRRRSGRGATGGTWSPSRRRIALAAVLAAIVTGAVGTVLAGSSDYIPGAIAYVMVTVFAAFVPPAITAQVIVGQMLVGSLLLGQDGPASLMLMPAFAGVVATTELLASVAWLDTPLRRTSSSALPGAGRAALVGGGVFGAVMLVTGLPGPGGLVAVCLAAGACIVLAGRLVKDAA